MELTRPTIEAITLAIPSPVAGEDELRLAAEAVRKELLERPSVPLATLRGTRDREMAIELSDAGVAPQRPFTVPAGQQFRNSQEPRG